jgi:hypothetical protein
MAQRCPADHFPDGCRERASFAPSRLLSSHQTERSWLLKEREKVILREVMILLIRSSRKKCLDGCWNEKILGPQDGSAEEGVPPGTTQDAKGIGMRQYLVSEACNKSKGLCRLARGCMCVQCSLDVGQPCNCEYGMFRSEQSSLVGRGV